MVKSVDSHVETESSPEEMAVDHGPSPVGSAVSHLSASMVTAAPPAPAPALPQENSKETDRRRVPREPDTDRRRASRSPKAHLFVTICHWSMVILLALNLLSGMRIGWGYMESPFGGATGFWGTLLGKLSPQGTMFGVNLITLHVVLAFAMLLVSGVYIGYLVRSRSTRKLQITRQDLHKLWHGMRSGAFWRNKAALWSANLLVYWLSFVMIAILVVSGVALYRLDWSFSTALGGYSLMRFLHALVAYALVPYAILHSILQWFFGRFWTIFKAQMYASHLRAGLLGLAITLPLVAGLYLANSIPTTLTTNKLPVGMAPPVLDGNPDDAVWQQASAVPFRTVKGVNNPDDYVDVMVKAVHDGQSVYFQFQWDDPDVSYKRFPLVKTEGGWKVLQTAFANADENVFYEDKLSIYFTDVMNGSCADTCHLGVGPYSAKGEKHGVHYTSRGEVGDVWHWKSVRTNPMGALTGEPGFMDDQHFRSPDPLPEGPPKERYSAGYHADPKTGGGYTYNFERLQPDKPLTETYVRPKMLPPVDVALPKPDANPATSEQGVQWWIHQAAGRPYTPEADTYPVGTMLPNIIIEPFQGDRADVRAQGAWRDGRWTVEVRRIFDTQSKFDIAFVPGKPLYMTIATYNRTQTRHGEHIVPVRLLLQP